MKPKKKTRAQKIKAADARFLRDARDWLIWLGPQILADHPSYTSSRLARAIEARLKLEPKK